MLNVNNIMVNTIAQASLVLMGQKLSVGHNSRGLDSLYITATTKFDYTRLTGQRTIVRTNGITTDKAGGYLVASNILHVAHGTLQSSYLLLRLHLT